MISPIWHCRKETERVKLSLEFQLVGLSTLIALVVKLIICDVLGYAYTYISLTIIRNNTATQMAAVVYAILSSEVRMDNLLIDRCQANQDTVFSINLNSTLNITNSNLTNNIATSSRGIGLMTGRELHIYNCIIKNNTASDVIIQMDSADVMCSFTNTQFIENRVKATANNIMINNMKDV